MNYYKRAFGISSAFSVGILITIALIGVVTASAGKLVGSVGKYGNYFVAIIFFAVGLHLIEVITIPFTGKTNVGMKSRGIGAAFVLGLIFGVALGPCTFAYMAPVLGLSFKSANENLIYAAALIISYGLGHCSVIIVAGTFTALVQKYMNWNERSKGAVIVKKICGVFVLLGGLYLIYVVS